MGCDVGVHDIHVPYCKPDCKEFKLVVRLESVQAQCTTCRLLHDFTVTLGGQIRIKKK